MDINYNFGFRNIHQTEAVDGALPKNQNSPQTCPLDLYAEQFSGSAFTALNHNKLKSWLYKIAPSAALHDEFKFSKHRSIFSDGFNFPPVSPNQMRWAPLKVETDSNFLESLHFMAGNGEIGQVGCAIYHYDFSKPMGNDWFFSTDGELLFVPFKGSHVFKTEFGVLEVNPHEICVIPRGVKFQVEGATSCAGYICENYGKNFELPYLSVLGANGLADARHFLYPKASFDKKNDNFSGTLFCKMDGNLWEAKLRSSPMDVVAWQGNLAPYKYNLDLFNTINTVSFDHPDPSIFTVLTSLSDKEGEANIDFVIFPPKWMVAKNTFRPPYFHRNYMCEYMGLISGEYDAKADGFFPGGASLHNRLIGHGPDSKTFKKAVSEKLSPIYQNNTLAFMFESNRIIKPSKFAMGTKSLEKDYLRSWSDLPKTEKL